MTPRHWMHWSVLGPMLTAAAGWICDTVTGDDVTCGVRVDR